MTETPPPAKPPAFMTDSELLLRLLPFPHAHKASFTVDGIPFEAGYSYEDGDVILTLTGTLGYMPFSAESSERRQLLLNILQSAQGLHVARFGINDQYQIIVTGSFRLDQLNLPDFVCRPLVILLQEVRPFAGLIGECLAA